MTDIFNTYPALLDVRVASRGKRVGRVLLHGVLLGLVSAALFVGVAVLARMMTLDWRLLVIVPAGGTIVVGLISAILRAATGRDLVDLMLGLRTVWVETGGHPTIRALAQLTVMGLTGLATGGLMPLLCAIVGRDSDGRHWQDRWCSLATIDIRHGRDVTRHPAQPSEVRQRSTKPREAREAIVEVRPGVVAATAPVGGPQALVGPPPSINQPSPQPPMIPPAAMASPSTRVTAAPAPPIAPPPERSWLLRFDTGQTCVLRGTVLLGRAPKANPGYPGATLVQVQDPSMTVSGTHMAVGATEIGVWVADLGSTNGSAIMTAVGRERAINAGTRVPVASAGRVRLGDRVMVVQEVRR